MVECVDYVNRYVSEASKVSSSIHKIAQNIKSRKYSKNNSVLRDSIESLNNMASIMREMGETCTDDNIQYTKLVTPLRNTSQTLSKDMCDLCKVLQSDVTPFEYKSFPSYMLDKPTDVQDLSSAMVMDVKHIYSLLTDNLRPSVTFTQVKECKVLTEMIFEASNTFQEKLKAYGTVWISAKKFKGTPIELSNIKLNGENVTEFDYNQVGNLLSKGLTWLNSTWSTTYGKLSKDIYEFGKTSWNLPFKSIAEMEKYMHLDYVGCYLDCLSQSDGKYALNNIKFVIWFNNNYANTTDEFFGGHSISYEIEFDNRGKVINAEDNEWRLEG